MIEFIFSSYIEFAKSHPFPFIILMLFMAWLFIIMLKSDIQNSKGVNK